MTLRGLVLAMAVLLTLLVGGATGVLFWRLQDAQRVEAEQQQLSTARAMSLAIDGRLQAYQGLLSGLTQGEALQSNDWRAFDAKARRLTANRDAWIVVADRDGRQYVNTRLPPGAALPTGRSAPWIWPELDQGRQRICNLEKGRVAPFVLCVDAPVLRDGRAAYHVSVMFLPQVLQGVIEGHPFGAPGIAAVIDRSGRIIWRTAHPERFVGAPATADLQAAMRRQADGVTQAVSLDGQPVLVAFSRSPLSGWTLALARPRPPVPLLAPQTLAYAALGIAALALALLAGLLTAGRLAGAIQRLHEAASHIRGDGAPGFRPTGIREVDAVGEALRAAIAERDASDERFELAQEAGDIGAWEWDAVRDEGRVSGSYKRMHGLSDVEGPLKLGQVLQVIHRDDREGYLARLTDATARAGPSTNHYRVVAPDGTIRWIFAKGRPIHFPDGALAGAVGIVRDVTAEHAAEAAVSSSQERLSLALAAGRMGVWEVDEAGRLTSDPAVNALIGLPPEAATTLASLAPNYFPGELDRVRNVVADARARGDPYFEVEFRFRRPDGDVRWLNARARARYGPSGEAAGAIGIVMDVTDRKADEERLHLLMREVDHRANNLMTVVQGTVALSSAPDAESLQGVINGRVQALARAHQLLASSRWQGADLRRLVAEELAPFALGDSHRTEVSGPSIPLPPSAAQAVAMALHELTTNAAKHGALSTAGGRVRVSWVVEDGWLKIRWEESGGPPVRRSPRRGFGTTVLQRALSGSIGGRTVLSWRKTGLAADLELPYSAKTAAEDGGNGAR